jgi:uncharacterized DUF497 family protein
MEMIFTWDPAKAERNRRSHGVSFEQAQEVFLDPFHIVIENDLIDGEQRYMAIGRIGDQTLIALVFMDRSEPDAMVIRIISARKAVAYEESQYQDQFD